MKKVRGDSGKKARYEQATEKYKLFQKKKDRINQMDGILTGKQREVVIPKPGEFFVVSSAAEGDALPSVNRKLIESIVRDSNKDSVSPHQRSQMVTSGLMSKNATMKLPFSVTERKEKQNMIRQNNLSHGGGTVMPMSTTNKRQVEDKTMTSLQGELNKQMSLPAFKPNRQSANRISHDFPLNSVKAKGAKGLTPLDTIEAYGKHGSQDRKKQLSTFTVEPKTDAQHGITGYGGMSNARFDKESAEGRSEDELKAAEDKVGLQMTVRRKQYEVLGNPQLKTSLTTNIRNIMRNQDKGLLTTSTRLLNAQVKHAESKQKMESHHGSLSPSERHAYQYQTLGFNSTKKAISTVDLLRQQKEIHKKMRQLSLESSEGADDTRINEQAFRTFDVRQGKGVEELDQMAMSSTVPSCNQQITNIMSMPVLPTAGAKVGAFNTEDSQQQAMGQADVQMFSQRDPIQASLNQPDMSIISNRLHSTVLMQLGDKDTKKLIKKKFDIANARSRDPTKTMTNSYKSKLNNPMTTSKKWKDQMAGAGATMTEQKTSSSGLIPRLPSTPMLVQYQNALIRENKNVSPFMVSGPELDSKHATIEAPKTKKQIVDAQRKVEQTLHQSQSLKTFVTLGEPLQEHMKYSESMSTLQKLRDVDEDSKKRPSSSVFKKGTSDFLKRKIMSTIGRQAYETGEFKKSLEKRYGSQIQGDSRDRTFLPIEAFDPLLDIEVPQDVIDQFKDPATGQTIGLSKWNFPSGEAELRECIVDGYIRNQDVYEIRWCHNRDIKKKVSRFNLIFKLEDKENYERRIFQAHQFRQEAETLMRYHYMIDNTQIPKVRTGGGGKKTAVALPELLDTTKTRISYLICTYKPYKQFVEPRPYKNVQAFFARDFNERYRFINFFQRWQDFNQQEPEKVVQSIHADMQGKEYNLALLQRLFQELDEDFLRAHKQIYCDLQLPYDKEKYRLFNHVLPKQKFVPNNEREVDETQPPALKKIPKRESNFERRLDKMSAKLHQAHFKKLKILQMCHKFKQQNLQKRLLQFEFTEPCKLDYLQKEHSLALSKFIKNIEDSKFDCEYDTSAIINEKRAEIDQLNSERKNQMTHHQEQYVDIEIPEEFIRSKQRFQRVVQIQFENTMREVFIKSIEQCKEQLRFAMQEVYESTGKPLIDTEAKDQISYEPDGGENDPERQLVKADVMHMSRDAVMQTRFRETQCFQFDITLEFDKDKKEIKANPHAEDWINAIPDHFETSLQSLKDVKCFLHDRLGRIHQDCGHVVFQTDLEYPEEYPEREVLHITFLLQRLFKVLEALLTAANEYSHILRESVGGFTKRLKEQELSVEYYQRILQGNKMQEREIDELFFEDSLQLGPIVARVGDLKKRLKKKLNELNRVILEEIKKKVEASRQQIGEEVDNILEVLKKEKKDYENIEEVTETKAFIKKLPDKKHEIQLLIRGVNDKIDVLDEFNFELTEQEVVQIWESFARPMEIQDKQDECIENLDELTSDFQLDLREMQTKLNQDIEDIEKEFEGLKLYEYLNQHLEASRKTEKLGDRIDETIKVANICNRRERLFGQLETDFSGMKTVQEKFEPFHKLWLLASQYYSSVSSWMEGEIFHLDGEELPKTIDEAIQTLKALKNKHFKDQYQTGLICQELRELYMEMKPYMPILSSFKNPDFKIRHYEIIEKDHQIVIDPQLVQSFNKLKEMGVMEIVDDIIEISAIATKQRQLESQLNKMIDEWKSVKFELADYRHSECPVLQGVQTIWDLLDEHIQKTMIIASSPYAKFMNSEALDWKSRLVKVQEILEEWSRAQRGWCYLWPIFNSPDIQGQLPEVYQTFTSMDKMWRIIMSQTQANPIVLDACNQHQVIENLKYCNETIESVKKKLNEYLHSKQMLFPRFFFLSNDDLLHILSQTKDPIRVQDHLNKCFEGIQLLHFEDQTLIVTSMISSMGEQVAFNKSIDPFVIKVRRETIEDDNEEDNSGRMRNKPRIMEMTVKEVRAIEDWLSDVEFQMRDSLRSNIRDSTVQYKDNQSKAEWIFAWPQQIVLAIDQIDWTERLESAIQSEAENSLRFAFKSEEQKVAELVDLIRTPNLSKADVQTLESLIVTDVHSRDTTQEIMQLNVRDIASFEWISQLRHYTSVEESMGRDKKKVTRLEIKISMINSTRLYGFEYQGSQTRLVITPLTDRCYRTLMGALQMNLGGAPEGPAGTGKTETTKDLAKALAKQCLVFNCSDQIDVATMGKFFKGLACCGAWACFDEFNRIELEVLSVIAQQILTIQSALMRKKPNAAFIFEEESIVLDAQCAVFITMNPTYAGRSQLPDNLKALFRPVAMMIPNYETIAEIQLYSYGFQNARQLSVKIVQSLKLSSEQLSTQSHYDYGMRAVKSIILASGAIRKESPPDQSEEVTVLRAISVCNIPKFINEDINQFNGIISDLFPEIQNTPQKYATLKHFVDQSLAENKLEKNLELETKILQLYETVQVRHGLMLVGAPMGGKTTIAKTLADALTRIERQKALDELGGDNNDGLLPTDNSRGGKQATKVNIHKINPKSISISKLYGDYEKVGDWMDGILAITVRDSAADKSGDTHWIMLDGPVDTLWIENLNTVLDDNKKLCLISGEIIKLTQQMTMMFEVEDLHEASPATVSRCGMVYVTPEKLGWEPLLFKWIQQLPDGMKEHGSHTFYRDLIMACVPAIMRFLFGKEQSLEEDQRLEGLKPVISVSKNWIFKSFLNLFESLLLDADTLESYNEKQDEANEKREFNQKKKAMNQMKSNRTDKTSEDSDEEQQQQKYGGFTSSMPVTNTKRGSNRQSVQKWYDIIEPKVINLLVQKFVMSVIWGFGGHLMTSARPAYNIFMHELLDQVFAPSNCMFEFKKRLDMNQFPKANCNLFSVFFHTSDTMWHKWDYEIDKYDILGDKEKSAAEIKLETSQERDDSLEVAGADDEDGEASPIGGMQFDEEFQNKVEYQNIMIATEDSIQQQFIMETIVGHQFPMLIVGDTGTGKTRAIKKLIQQLLGKISAEGKYGWENGEMVLSATSTPHQIQRYTESKLEKHKKGVYGPKNPNNHLLIFIDDLNMPVKEKFGAQPSIEMMRQIIDTNGFYNEKTLEFSLIVRQLFLCAMGTPGGGRSLPSMRLLRHFNLFNFPNMSKETMTRIFKKILEWGFAPYHQSWQKQIITMTEMTIETYQHAVKVLLPLPRKAHYLFNMRQVSEIIQGLFSVPADIIEMQKEKLTSLKKLWIHEVMRVFSDRLISDEDKTLFIQQCLRSEDNNFIKPTDLECASSLIFCNFVNSDTDHPIYMESKDNDLLRLSLGKVVEQYNESRTGGREKMSVLLFDYLLQHMARVSRIIAKPFGNGLLIGLGGNGRKTIAKIATFINDCGSFRINLHKNYGYMEWLDELRNLYKTLGIDNKKIVFSFSDKEIKEETFIEDINNILNVGELTSLFNPEDEEEIHYDLEKQLKKAKVKNTTPEATREFFNKRCKRNLHLLLFMSPAGNQLQSYFRKYPSLVNCTSIDWFLNWPTEALKAVSDHYLLKLQGVIMEATQIISPGQSLVGMDSSNTVAADKNTHQKALETIAEGFEERDEGSAPGTGQAAAITDRMKSQGSAVEITATVQKDEQKKSPNHEIEMTPPGVIIGDIDDQMLDPEAQQISKMSIKDRVSQIFTQVHSSAMQLADTYLEETKKQVYITPVMFMSVFQIFETLLSRKNQEIEHERSKYEQGVQKMEEAKQMIQEMDAQLQELRPQLIEKEKQVGRTMKRLDQEKKEVGAIKDVVDAETEEAETEKRAADEIKVECQQALNLAQPFFDRAIKALRTLSNNDFVLMRSFQTPPKGVVLALEACCIMLGIAPGFKKVDGVKKPDYLEKSKKLLSNYKQLLDKLENYPKENIDAGIIEKIKPYLDNPSFQPEQIRTASEAAEGLCKWTIAIIKFDEVYKQITPKRQSLEAAEEKVRITQEKLQEKQAQLSKLMEQIAELEAVFNQSQEEKQDLLNKKQDAENKLERANALMSSIGDEKANWIKQKKKLAEDKDSLLGDMIIATSFVNYLGPFEGSYRLKILTETWQQLNQKYQVKQTYNFNLQEILGDVEKISQWTIDGLPNENMAFENMIIIDETIDKKYPVIIDPEGQAFRYMREHMNEQPETSGYHAPQSRMCLKASSSNTVKQLQFALQQGSIVFCENSGEVTHPALLSILRKDISSINGDTYISFNDMNIDFDSDFRIYIFSHLSNPHFSPEVQQLSKVLNFSVTREGLEQQLLQIICQNELSREEEERERYAKQQLQMQKKKREVFNKILNTLRNSGEEILESDGFVKTLNESKEVTTEIEKKIKQAQNNEAKIKEMREKFEETAKQGARLYFAVQDLKLLDDMYQFSMNWFRILFKQTFSFGSPDSDEEDKTQQDHQSDSNSMIGQQQQSKRRRAAPARMPNQQDLSKKQRLVEMEKRAQVLKNQFREILYRNVCMSLFEHHKLLFAFFISLKVYEKDQSFQEGLDRLQKQHRAGPSPKAGKEFESASKLDQSRLDCSSKVSNDQKSSNNQQNQEQVSHSSIAQSLSRRSQAAQNAVRRQAGASNQGGGRTGGAGVLSRHDQSDRMTAIDEEREYAMKEEEKKLAIDESLLKYTLTGLMMADSEPYEFIDNPRADLFTEAMWSELHQLTTFQCYELLLEKIVKDVALWERFMLCERGAEQAFELLPEPFQSSLPHFAWIPLIRCLKPELTTLAIRRYVAKSLGRFFVSPIIFNLREVYETSQAHTPLLLILTPGNDPMDQIISLSKEAQCRVISVSLGKGQGEKAKQSIKECQKGGSWVILQNCHLSKSFLPELEQLVESLQVSGSGSQQSSAGMDDMSDKKDFTNPQFRIWMTTMSVPYFPQMLLHQSHKITSEPPKGIKSSMIRSYNSVINSKTDLAEYNECRKMDIWQRLYLSLSFFHAIVRERRRFGPLGWTARYDFNDSDFRVSMLQLRNMVESFEKVPFKALHYLTGLCNYGGRVTDDRDRRTLATILDDFYNENVIGSDTYYIVNQRFKKYFIFRGETAREYLDYVKHLPDEESPQLMGLHENAIIQQAMNEANTIFASTLKLTASSASNDRGGEETTQMVKKMTEDILHGIREPFKIKDVERRYPFKYEESMNSVLLQELARYNNLIETIRASLEVLKKTLEGKLVSNSETDELLQSIKNNSIPEKWLKRSYPSRKSLLGYVEDLKKRIAVFEEWIKNDKPNCFWISGFFFTQSFLTGVKQNYARKHQYPIDKVDFSYKVLKFDEQALCDRQSPQDGCYLNGLFLEGAAWDDENGVLRDSDPKVIHVPLPVMHFVPKYVLQQQSEPQSQQPLSPTKSANMSSEVVSQSRGDASFLEGDAQHQVNRQYTYECPAYKTSERAGQLLTTGHNTNYIQMIDLNSGSEPPSIWIRRGVALLCQLDN